MASPIFRLQGNTHGAQRFIPIAEAGPAPYKPYAAVESVCHFALRCLHLRLLHPLYLLLLYLLLYPLLLLMFSAG